MTKIIDEPKVIGHKEINGEEEDIQRDVTIFAPRLGMGATNKKE